MGLFRQAGQTALSTGGRGPLKDVSSSTAECFASTFFTSTSMLSLTAPVFSRSMNEL